MSVDYQRFLDQKRIVADAVGFEIPRHTLNKRLFPFQTDIVKWAIKRGRAAIFADCGMGKCFMSLEWARRIHELTGKDIIILAPLAVARQTVREGEKFGVKVTLCKTGADVRRGINVTNYERLHHFRPDRFAGVVADESSILKAYDGKLRREITEFAKSIPYRLACTATPAPNDLPEIINHAEFLDIMSNREIIGVFFRQDGDTSHKFRLKNHAKADFWRWMASWSVALRKPSDLGYEDGEFILPPLCIEQHTVEADAVSAHALFDAEALTMQERRDARRGSIGARVEKCAAMVNGNSEQWIVWCDLNSESNALAKAIPGAAEIVGADSAEKKEQAVVDFIDGKVRVIVSKPSIFGWGLNLQNCAHMAFVGLSDSYEAFYQAVRRCWRFGQTRPVECHVITAETEGAVVRNIERKERQASEMFDNLVRHMSVFSSAVTGAARKEEAEYVEGCEEGRNWRMYLGDSIETMQYIPDESVGMAIFSPPFPGMYVYSNSARDMGNCLDVDAMLEHFKFMVGKDHLLRVLMPGRSCCVHLVQLTAFKSNDGYSGIKDYRGRVIAMMEEAGWIYYGEATIDKNPQMKAIRTKDHGLLFKSLAKDSAQMHMACADYLLQFRKPGENPRPIRAGISEKYNNLDGWISSEEWIRWARPVWYAMDWNPEGTKDAIHEGDVLNVSQARETDDEKHLCPLQLGVIERAVKLWTAPGETVYDPFTGIGSTGYEAIRLGRKFVGGELKPSYFNQAVRNLRKAETETRPMQLFEEELATV